MDWTLIKPLAGRRETKLRASCSVASGRVTDALRQWTILILLSGLATVFTACGGSGSSSTPPPSGSAQVSGNWEFGNLSPGASFLGGLQGGFLLQTNGSISGQAVYSISLPSAGGTPTVCDSGTASITGTVTGQTVSLTAVAGSSTGIGETFALTGALSLNTAGNSILTISSYTYTPTAPTGGTPCGEQETVTPTQNQAFSVPALTGSFTGFFHSTAGGGSFANQDFPVTGILTQGQNIGASSATVTGSLVFRDPVTLANNYPCLTNAALNGTISGNTVLLQIFSTNGLAVGQIGQTPGSSNLPTAVTYDSTQNGYVLHNLAGPSGTASAGYVVTTKPCPNGDSGNLCFTFGTGTACNQPITFTPFALTFAPQMIRSTTSTQTVTLFNNSSQALTGLSLNFLENDSSLFYALGGDFNGKSNYTETDTCTPNSSFSLAASGQTGSSCTIKVSFSPQESCPWLPVPPSGLSTGISGLLPSQCPVPLTARVSVTLPSGSADADNVFSFPITGSGTSFVVPSTPEIDFGAEAVGEASQPQTLTFTNQSSFPVAIFGKGTPCSFTAKNSPPPEPRPPDLTVNGFQFAETASIGFTSSAPIQNDQLNPPTVAYFCDIDLPSSKGGSETPNFQITSDGCSGLTLQPIGSAGNTCSLQITFSPQPATWKAAGTANVGLDDFLQLNTAWCGDANNSPEPECEVDSGRFPVEIKTNAPSPLRMFPSAGMDFGFEPKGSTSAPLTITLFNDPVDPNTGTVNILSKVVSSTDFFETDTCLGSLAPNNSCAITVTFTPSIVGFEQATLQLGYTLVTASGTQAGLTQTIHMRGTGQ